MQGIDQALSINVFLKHIKISILLYYFAILLLVISEWLYRNFRHPIYEISVTSQVLLTMSTCLNAIELLPADWQIDGRCIFDMVDIQKRHIGDTIHTKRFVKTNQEMYCLSP